METLQQIDKLTTAHFKRCTQAGIWFAHRMANAAAQTSSLPELRAATEALTVEFNQACERSAEQLQLAIKALYAENKSC